MTILKYIFIPFLILIFFSYNLSFAYTHFPSSLDPIPKDYKGKVFKISDEFPQETPDKNDIKNWEKYHPTQNPKEYIENIKKYVFEGQIDSSWNGFGNKVRKWYHMPWLHTGNTGREFIWGLNKEDGKNRPFLSPHEDSAQVWAFTLFNPMAGYTLGGVWKNLNFSKMNHITFRNGAVIFKMIFTTLTPKELPYLEGTLEISGNITSNSGDILKNPDHFREIQKLYLVQMDVSIKDSRLKNYTGWAMASFVYNNKNTGKNYLEKLGLVGVQWGNDPLVTMKKYSQGEKIKESYITKFGKNSVKLTGYNGRLNGLANHPRNSCMACHSLSQYHPNLPTGFNLMTKLFFTKDENKDEFFKNIPSGTPYTSGYFSTDFNFQLFLGLTNYIINHKIDLIDVPHSEEVRRAEKYKGIILKMAQSKCLNDIFHNDCRSRLDFLKEVPQDSFFLNNLRNWRGVSVSDN